MLFFSVADCNFCALPLGRNFPKSRAGGKRMKGGTILVCLLVLGVIITVQVYKKLEELKIEKYTPVIIFSYLAVANFVAAFAGSEPGDRLYFGFFGILFVWWTYFCFCRTTESEKNPDNPN